MSMAEDRQDVHLKTLKITIGSCKKVLTTLINDHSSKLFIMMNTAIIKDNHTPLLWIWVQLWESLNLVHSMRYTGIHTTCSWMKVKNLSFVTEPSKISRAIIPSVVRAERIEYQMPRRNVACRTQGVPTTERPYSCCTVWLSTALSSRATKRSGSVYWAISASQIVRSSSSLSAADF